MMKMHTVQATPAARVRLEAYFNEIVDLRRAGDLSDVSQYASRWCEQAARLAIVLHAGLHGAAAHRHRLGIETAENAIKLAKWFTHQQLDLLTKGRRQAAQKKEDEVLKLLETRHRIQQLDYVTARDVHRARIVSTAPAAASLLARMEKDYIFTGEDIRPAHGGKGTRVFRTVAGHNPVPQ